MNKRNKFIIALSILYVFALGLIFLLASFSDVFTRAVLVAGNTILYVGSMISLVVSGRFASSDNSHKFVRGVMGGTFIKFGICLIAGVIYILIYKKDVQWTDIFALMFLYIIYTVVETTGLAKVARNK